jgi:hypothetical protein
MTFHLSFVRGNTELDFTHHAMRSDSPTGSDSIDGLAQTATTLRTMLGNDTPMKGKPGNAIHSLT